MSQEDPVPPPINLFREADRILMARYIPAGVLINSDLEILQFRGRTDSFSGARARDGQLQHPEDGAGGAPGRPARRHPDRRAQGNAGEA